MVSWEYIWRTLRCTGVAGVSPLLSIGWWYLSSVPPKRHCCRISAADKGCRVYPLDLRSYAVALCSGCTSVSESSQTYAQDAKSSNKNSSTQTDENITNVKCSPLKLLQPHSSISKPNISITTPVISTSSSTQAELLPSTSSTEATVSELQSPIHVCNVVHSTNNNAVVPDSLNISTSS
ncbi:uncharacterized protein TNCV_4524651 [Trichonephila clavipes]|nr:uncharacterized protein TNCV_4524651 [Trichonephila clavipes]